MKFHIIPIILSLFITLSLDAQKHDYIWPFGTEISGLPQAGTNCVLDFNTSPPSIYNKKLNSNFAFTSMSLCDSTGSLLAYSNGLRIMNSAAQLMENGDSINFGNMWVNRHERLKGYLSYSGGFFLPFPKHPNQYILFHTQTEQDSFDVYKPVALLYSIIDFNQNGGLGKVISKNNVLMEGRIVWPMACKHGNGRDWWIMSAQIESTEHSLFRLSEHGVEGPFIQDIGPAWQDEEGYSSQCAFSPDGKLYVRHSGKTGPRIYDFNRCTGELSNLRIIPYTFGFFTDKLVFSEDNSYLYLSNFRFLYQIRLVSH